MRVGAPAGALLGGTAMRWDMGVDLGTRNVRVAMLADGPVLSTPAALAMREGREQPVSAGEAARQLLGRECEGVVVCYPLRDGALTNSLHALKLFQWLFHETEDRRRTRKFRVLISCAPFARPVQREALLQAALDAGASEAALVRSDAAMAVGAGLDILRPEGCMLLDAGAGKITATVFTFGRVAAEGFLPYGMERVAERVERALTATEGFRVGPRTAQDLVRTLGCALPESAPDIQMQVGGLNPQTRLPEIRSIHRSMVSGACEDVVREMTGMCQGVIAHVPGELAADLNDAGCVLAGGGALLSGLDKRVGDALGVPCRVAESPEASGILGLNRMINKPEPYEGLFLETMVRTVRH